MKSIIATLFIASVSAYGAFFISYGFVLVFLVSAISIYARVFLTVSTIQKLLAYSLLVGFAIGYFAAFRVEYKKLHFPQRSSVSSIIFTSHNANKTAEDIYEYFTTVTSKDAAAFFTALVTGRRKFIPLAVQDIVRRSGISHLLALSGFHLSVLLFLIAFMRKCIPYNLFYGISCICVWLYCLWIGFIPSLWRAGLMYSISALGLSLIGMTNFFISWCFAGLFMMIFFPHAVTMPGFVLSMLALYGVVKGGNFYKNIFMKYVYAALLCIKKIILYWRKNTMHSSLYTIKNLCVHILENFFTSIAVSTGAAFTTAWYSLLLFKASYPIGIAASLLLTPFVVLFMILGILILMLKSLIGILSPLFLWMEFSYGISIIHIGIKLIGLCMTFMIKGINYILAYTSSFIGIYSVGELLIFYAILIGICIIPHCATILQHPLLHKKIYVLFKRKYRATLQETRNST